MSFPNESENLGQRLMLTLIELYADQMNVKVKVEERSDTNEKSA